MRVVVLAVAVAVAMALTITTTAYAAPPSDLIWVPPTALASAPAPASPHILYINDCKPSGCIIKPGLNDSRTNTSAIVNQQRVLSPYSGDQATWDAMVECMRENYQDFLIDVVTVDPGNVPHYEVMVAGLPTDILSFSPNGVAPFNCDVIPNGISFAFANLFPDDALEQCWVASQESAHVFGLEHSMNPEDAMTYAINPPRKRFVDESACIGTAGCCSPGSECACGRTSINSYQRLLAVLGGKPPALEFATPSDGAVVPAGFPIEIAVNTPVALRKLEVYVDGVLFSRFSAPPYTLETDRALPLGTHILTAIAEDANLQTASVEISVTRGTSVTPEPDPEPEPEPDPQPRPQEGGCNASGGSSLLIALLALLLITTRRRRYA